MSAYLMDWVDLLARWLHFIVGIAWIGSSFYFIWLDNHLRAPRGGGRDDIAGEVWSVHGGGFYHAQKYRVAPPELPDPLHWFKWEAYTTWLSGMFLLVTIYWLGAGVYLVDRSVADLEPWQAIAVSAAFIVGGWVVYDGLCRSPLAAREGLFAGILFALVVLLAWGLCSLFGGRAAYVHFGAVLGTIMVANVAMVIIPGQKKMVAAAARGEAPDPAPGIKAKQRSVHNTYFTLPVLFAMTSNHFPFAYAHRYSWVLLAGIALAGALIRAWFVARHAGRASPLPLLVAGVVLVAMAALAMPASRGAVTAGVSLAEVRDVLDARCTSCHSESPSNPGFAAPPAGMAFDTNGQVRAEAARIHEQVVVTRGMPIGNLTNMTDEERQLIDDWYRGQAEGAPGE